MSFDFVFQNVRALLPKNSAESALVQADVNIGIRNGQIAEITTATIEGKEILDGRGTLHLMPGVIDSQVHMREPGFPHKEDLEAGTKGAALGGITSVFEMPNTMPPTTTAELLQDKLNRAANRAWVNYGFFIGGSHDNIHHLAELEKKPGCPGIKIFMGSSTGNLLVEDDATLERIMKAGSRRIIFHAEDEPRLRERKKLAQESHDVRSHPEWRDEETAAKAVERVLRLAEKTGRNIHVLHVTSQKEMQLLAQAKRNPAFRQRQVTVEVLPQHLTLSAPECYERLGTKAQQNPPIRGEIHRQALWKALEMGVVDVIGSDHAPHTLEEKSKEYPATPSGMPGVQTLLPLMLNFVNEGKLSLERLTELVCENPRWIFGATSKGRIEVGFDADFTLVDLKKSFRIENSWIASRSGWTPFDGMTVTGFPVGTMVGGQFVMRDNQLLRPRGQMVRFV